MGKPRGKGEKQIEAASNDDDGSGGEEVAMAPATKRRGRPQKPLGNDADEVENIAAEVVEDGDGIKPVVPSKDSKGSAESGGKKKRRRRRLKRSSDDSAEDEDENDHVERKSNGFRPNGSRRKSTPRRAAEAGVECNSREH
ncbi:uncharacterized protein LOC133894822 [Phragmites australis]|uniref:uncharacterized protein LOC133894822 n=1 Tax=Phragmites australis TaxID=29695 RepID=UPI002D7672D0|nr:uncharacterized protein LOC133894822 [Phragmites australis]